MNKKINDDYNNENSDQMIRHNNNNHNDNSNLNQQDKTNFKMLFDPNNPDKPIYVKEKLSNIANKSMQQQGNAFKRSNRYENKK